MSVPLAARNAAYAARYGERVDTYTWGNVADAVLDAATPVIAAAIWGDVLRLVEDHIDPAREHIAAMPFGASLDQLMGESYGAAEPAP